MTRKCSGKCSSASKDEQLRRADNSRNTRAPDSSECACNCHKDRSLELGDPEVLKRTLHFIDEINDESVAQCLWGIKRLIIRNPEFPIFIVLTSPGGSSTSALSFYDTITKIWRPNIVMIGAGEIASAALILMSAGKTRLLTKGTRVFLHNPLIAGEVGGGIEDHFKVILEGLKIAKERYQAVLVETSGGKLSLKKIDRLMAENTYLSDDDCKKYGLINGIIG